MGLEMNVWEIWFKGGLFPSLQDKKLTRIAYSAFEERLSVHTQRHA